MLTEYYYIKPATKSFFNLALLVNCNVYIFVETNVYLVKLENASKQSCLLIIFKTLSVDKDIPPIRICKELGKSK